MRPYLITARTSTMAITFTANARSSIEAAILTAEVLGDQVFSITVTAGVR